MYLKLRKGKKIKSVALLGSGGGKAKKLSDNKIIVPSSNKNSRVSYFFRSSYF